MSALDHIRDAAGFIPAHCPTRFSTRPQTDRSGRRADLVLLCSFGPELASSRTHQELRDALLLAGYRGDDGIQPM